MSLIQNTRLSKKAVKRFLTKSFKDTKKIQGKRKWFCTDVLLIRLQERKIRYSLIRGLMVEGGKSPVNSAKLGTILQIDMATLRPRKRESLLAMISDT